MFLESRKVFRFKKSALLENEAEQRERERERELTKLRHHIGISGLESFLCSSHPQLC